MLTKEQILPTSFYPHECGGMIECVTKQDALKSMSEFAEIQAIAFMDWIDADYSKDENDIWDIENNDMGIPNGKYTTQQLYHLFKQSQEK